MSILPRSLKHSPIRANFLGSGAGFGEFNYAGEARNYFRNSAIETVVLRAQCYFMYGLTYSKNLDRPGKVANPARGQLNREN